MIHQGTERITIEEALELLPGRYQPGARAAFDAIELDDQRKYMHGASLAIGKRIFSTARNLTNKTHPAEQSKFRTLHAETNLIVNCDRSSLSNMVCFVVRVSTVRNFITASKPCTTCTKLLKKHGISVVVYTEIDGWKIQKL